MVRAWIAAGSLLVAAQISPAGESCGPSCDPFARAGHPEQVAKLARPTNTPHYCGYWVGGGCARRHCDDRYPVEEGTFGWDYQGCGLLPRRVALGWWHSRRSQGGTGAYKTTTPHVPDVPNLIRPVKKDPHSQQE